jgi:dolichyl-phosphate mannosyltransferase polypeptide 3
LHIRQYIAHHDARTTDHHRLRPPGHSKPHNPPMRRLVSTLTTIVQLYLSAFLGFVPLPAKVQQDVIPVVRLLLQLSLPQTPKRSHITLQLPFWALVSFGAYLLGKLGYGVYTFKDQPEAHEELLEQIKLAKADLSKRGVTVD